MTIPASEIVQVTPSVLAAGGRALDIIGLILTNSTRVPIGAVQPFSNTIDVQDYFGAGSTESALAAIYFDGFDNSAVKSQRMLFAQYNTASVAAYLRGGTLALTLDQLKALPIGSLTLTVNGSAYNAASINFATAVSFSDAANIINTAFGGTGSIPFVTTFDSISSAFLMTTNLTGSGASIGFCGNSTLAGTLLLTSTTGAVTSQGAVAAVPASFMNNLIQVTQDWALFMLSFDPDDGVGNTNKLAFAQWNGTQNNRWAFICWDTDASPTTTVPALSSLGQLLAAQAISGTSLIWAPDATKAAFICGSAASIDFDQHNGRITFAFRKQSGLVADVTDQTIADNLVANFYNYYGAFATANDLFIFLYPGSVSGDFDWLDSYINQIWLNQNLQLAMMVLLTNTKSIPYNNDGYSLIRAAAQDPIFAAVNFGAIRAGVTLSQAQTAEVNNDAGINISDTLNRRGWYFQVSDASPQTRAARGSPPCTLWYMDGQSVQKINISSIELQ